MDTVNAANKPEFDLIFALLSMKFKLLNSGLLIMLSEMLAIYTNDYEYP
jgi:hypothetical protein